ncbi:MAG: hypothetical protein WAU11_11015 [Ignavibacteriaceae bacterium]
MKYILIFSLGILFSCSTLKTENINGTMIIEELPQIKDDFYPTTDSVSYLMISPSQFSKTYNVNSKNIFYNIAINDFNKVIFISTEDKSFITPEKLMIGNSLSDVQSISKNEIVIENGWANYITLESGWSAAFVEGKSMTSRMLKEDSKISFFFKR